MNRILVAITFPFVFASLAHPQQSSTPQPLNANVSDQGTSFTFSPAICPGCVEAELGFQNLQDVNTLPVVLTVALPRGRTDASVLVNALDSEAPGSKRVTHFGNRFDFIVRQQVAATGGFLLTLAPRGTVFDRDGDGGRAGLTLDPQYTWGKNSVAFNLTWTGGIGISGANPQSDYLTSFDYTRTLANIGTAAFVGFQQEDADGYQTMAIEEGFVIPFRNGQVELATEQLNLNTSPEAQFQARVIFNWGKVFGRK